MPNQLIHETSPYLLQHAHNPVNWFPWSDEALQKAKHENKPILVSIGYAACHWCHVMERESFEDEDTAALMNEHFINIKIDREERPDLDHIYMDAVQAMTGSGGWPLNVFLTPEAKPFYGGTYFPPVRAFNRPSWKEVLASVATAFKEKRDEIDTQAQGLTEHLLQANSFGLQSGNDRTVFSKEKITEAYVNIMKNADKEWGGFGGAPKFPQTFTIQFLLRYYHINKEQQALQQACLSLDKMIDGGIYDQAGGGFARYSTDKEWLAPHFEKMLYDNALLVSVLSEAYQLTKNERYAEVIAETIAFVQRELMHNDGGFYSALDADSEGEEGKFYVWQYEEVKKLLGDDGEIFCDYYDVTRGGNWEEKNILRVKKTFRIFAEEKNIDAKELKKILQGGLQVLFQERSKRTRPQLDDKVILGWNALMNTAASKAFAATGKNEYRELAVRNMKFLLQYFQKEDESFYHTWKNGIAKMPAFLDDYAYLVQALINLQEITGEVEWLNRARNISELVIRDFSEDETGFFFFTGVDQKDVIIRKKEVYDGAMPSGNSIMLLDLYHLSIFFNITAWRKRVERAISSLGNAIIRYPGSFGIWSCLLQEMVDGTREIIVMGGRFSEYIQPVLAEYIPHKVFMATDKEREGFPLLTGRSATGDTFIYLCRDYSCLKPVKQVVEFIQLVSEGN